MTPLRHAGRFRVGTVPIGSRRAVQHVEHYQDDSPDQRDERDEEPPAGAVDVVEPPDRHGDARDQESEATRSFRPAKTALAGRQYYGQGLRIFGCYAARLRGWPGLSGGRNLVPTP